MFGEAFRGFSDFQFFGVGVIFYAASGEDLHLENWVDVFCGNSFYSFRGCESGSYILENMIQGVFRGGCDWGSKLIFWGLW